MNNCSFNCNQGRSCKTPDACWLPTPEDAPLDDPLDSLVVALFVAVALLAIFCASVPALYAWLHA